jgi:hypothetical protein
MRWVGEIAEPDEHIADDRAGQRNRDRDSEDGMRQGQRVEVSIVQKEEARGKAPDQGEDGQDGIGLDGRAKRWPPQ